MEKDTFERFNREMRSFFVLIILNIVGAGIAMAYGVTLGVTNITSLIAQQQIQLQQVAITGFALIGCIIAIRWLINSAELLDIFDDLREGQETKTEIEHYM